ncbi:hypothetical protein C1Y63_05085 [Corynebacterium sp. 13CS0277]|uniref:hypothetical protein n=1 Tax=Corynebacterium sp. 13CS0277 TaxID=2071994 RepID=UPI000D024D69|nr:hypothetical protein [Corynebacterium sp. 13CS0277]PRQ11560.1 hypothetical protein C1Y63_05085 [Corynebacterium sp. 13CS0277]
MNFDDPVEGHEARSFDAVALDVDALADEVRARVPLIAAALDEVCDQLREAALRVDSGESPSALDPEQAARLKDLEQLVEMMLAPHRDFYSYREARVWALDARPTVDALRLEAEESPSAELLELLERALAAVDENALVSDSSDGYHGDFLAWLLAAHGETARALAPLSPQAQSRLVQWMFSAGYAKGVSGFYTPEILEYADVLDAPAVAEFEQLIESSGQERWYLDSVRRDLAVVRRDADALEAFVEPYLDNGAKVRDSVIALNQAGFPERAVALGRKALPHLSSGWLADQAVNEIALLAAPQMSAQELYEFRREAYERLRTVSSVDGLLSVIPALSGEARQEAEAFVRDVVEPRFLERNPVGYIRWLVGQGRSDEAWRLAEFQPVFILGEDLAYQLCELRAVEHPEDVLDLYGQVVQSVLEEAKQPAYRKARTMLLEMRQAAHRAGAEAVAEYEDFFAYLVDKHRRRRTMLEIFAKAGLMI